MRASDADRDAYIKVLQDAYLEGRLTKTEYDDRLAAALKAVTYADLLPLLHDLPVPHDLPGPPRAVVTRHQGVDVASPTSDSSPLVAAFSELHRDSRWVVSDGQVAVAVFGSVKLDLAQAQLTTMDGELKANAIFGEVKITVPADIEVQVAGTGVFGEFKRIDKRTNPVASAGRPVLRITGIALFGSVEVRVVDEPVTGSERLIGPPPPALGS